MFGTTGFFEILIILAVALLVLGPSQLFTLIRQTGLILRKCRILYARVTDEIDRQIRLDEMLKSDKTKQKNAIPKRRRSRTGPQTQTQAQTRHKNIKKPSQKSKTPN